MQISTSSSFYQSSSLCYCNHFDDLSGTFDTATMETSFNTRRLGAA